MADENSAEARAVRLAVAAADGFGARWLGFDADGLHVHRRSDVVLVFDPAGPLALPTAYAAARPIVQVNAVDGKAVAGAAPYGRGDAFYVPGGVPGGYVSADTFAGYAPPSVNVAALRQLDGLEDLAEDAVVPELPGPLLSAVAESALAVLTRVESGSIGKTQSEFQVSTLVRRSVRLVEDPLREIWETYAAGYRVLA